MSTPFVHRLRPDGTFNPQDRFREWLTRQTSGNDADIERISRVLAAHGITASALAITVLWKTYSDLYYAAGWYALPSDDDLLWKDLDYALNL